MFISFHPCSIKMVPTFYRLVTHQWVSLPEQHRNAIAIILASVLVLRFLGKFLKSSVKDSSKHIHYWFQMFSWSLQTQRKGRTQGLAHNSRHVLAWHGGETLPISLRCCSHHKISGIRLVCFLGFSFAEKRCWLRLCLLNDFVAKSRVFSSHAN